MDGGWEQKLDQLLNSPEGMEKIGQMMAALGGGQATEPPVKPPAPATDPTPDLSPLLRLAPLLSQLGKDDDNTVLLNALRPYLSKDRTKRLDDSMKLMQLLKLLPLLREGGNLL